ncbi:hypothetical protein [Cupriavidus numazuensis]|uniref:hypothetical protein n=1 Tax=Cupriavidus numazuensis TaxID=221992 RepID=UPI001BA5789D|nr:hypothetical protein [Cupriavidus numazuensis]
MHADSIYARVVDLVHTYRAASVVLVQRHLELDAIEAESLLRRMADETRIVRRLRSGLYFYTGNLHGEDHPAD